MVAIESENNHNKISW